MDMEAAMHAEAELHAEVGASRALPRASDKFQMLRLRQQSEHESFHARFHDKVNVDAIMSGSVVVGRYEARLMLCQLRAIDIGAVTFTDPGVLMLDGMALPDLDEFLLTADETIREMLEGEEEDEFGIGNGREDVGEEPAGVRQSVGRPQAASAASGPSTTLEELNKVFDGYKNADSAEVRTAERSEFFEVYTRLDVLHKLSIPPEMRSLIDSALFLGPSNQDTILRSVELPTMARATMAEMHGGEGYRTATGAGRKGAKNTALYGEQLHAAHKQETDYDAAHRIEIAQNETKNLRQWISRNRGSMQVWFFLVGVWVVLSCAVQVWIDYAYGHIWRAISMQMLSVAAVLIIAMEADTEFIRATIQMKLFNYYQFLRDPSGRCMFYLFMCFLCFEHWTIKDILPLSAGFMLLILTGIRMLLHDVGQERMVEFCGLMIDSDFARERFNEFDQDDDGYLKQSDMHKLRDDVGFCPFTGWLDEVLFWSIDSQTNDGLIDVHEFVQYCIGVQQRHDLKLLKKYDRKTI